MNAAVRHPHLPSIAELVRKREPVRDVNAEYQDAQSRAERLGDQLSNVLGSTGFVTIILIATTAWMIWNVLLPQSVRFDAPWGYDVYQFVATVIQLALMPLILLCQNLQERHTRLRAENDYQVNVHAAEVVDALLHHTEYQSRLLQELTLKLEAIEHRLVNHTPETEPEG